MSNESTTTEEKEQSSEANFYRASAEDFKKIPGSPIAYWCSEPELTVFEKNRPLSATHQARVGLQSNNNNRFLRFWHEVSFDKINENSKSLDEAQASGGKWFPYHKGGAFRKWYGNNEYVVNWENSGEEIIGLASEIYGSPSRTVRSKEYYFRESLTWSTLSSGAFAVRWSPHGFMFDIKGSCIFPTEISHNSQSVAGALNSCVVNKLLSFTSPTIDYSTGAIEAVPIPSLTTSLTSTVSDVVEDLILKAKEDWNRYETSWHFHSQSVLERRSVDLERSWNIESEEREEMKCQIIKQEEENNRIWIDAYGLQGELSPEVSDKEITLASTDQKTDMAAFISYAVGCMFGRYSLNKPGLILANTNETLENYLAQIPAPSFMPDGDNILPILDAEWFEDDIVARFRDFLRVTFSEETLQENIRFIEESLGKDLRKYFVNDFFKNHISNERAYGYKKRPIYWLFQSPKKSFQALIYMHRYNRDTVNLLLNDYLREYQNKLQNRRSHLNEILASESTSPRDKTAATKEQNKIDKQLTELADWERDVIYPLATQRIEIDLDDGVKTNYPKFGKALAKIPSVS